MHSKASVLAPKWSRVHSKASVLPPTFLAITLFNFLTFRLYSSPVQESSCTPELPLNHTHIKTQLREPHFRSWKLNFVVNFLEVSRNETIVSKRYFEQRPLDGRRSKAQAYWCKIGLTAGWKPRGFSIF